MAGANDTKAPEQGATVTPPAASGGITKDQVDAWVKEAIGAAITPVLDQIKALPKSLTAEEISALIPKAPTAEEIKALIAGELTARQESQDKLAAKKAVRQGVIDKKLKDVDPALLTSLPDTDNVQELEAAADAIVAGLEKVKKAALPPVNAAAADGGATPGKDKPAKPAKISVLPEGLAKFAASAQPK